MHVQGTQVDTDEASELAPWYHSGATAMLGWSNTKDRGKAIRKPQPYYIERYHTNHLLFVHVVFFRIITVEFWWTESCNKRPLKGSANFSQNLQLWALEELPIDPAESLSHGKTIRGVRNCCPLSGALSMRGSPRLYHAYYHALPRMRRSFSASMQPWLDDPVSMADRLILIGKQINHQINN